MRPFEYIKKNFIETTNFLKITLLNCKNVSIVVHRGIVVLFYVIVFSFHIERNYLNMNDFKSMTFFSIKLLQLCPTLNIVYKTNHLKLSGLFYTERTNKEQSISNNLNVQFIEQLVLLMFIHRRYV